MTEIQQNKIDKIQEKINIYKKSIDELGHLKRCDWLDMNLSVDSHYVTVPQEIRESILTSIENNFRIKIADCVMEISKSKHDK